MRKETVIALAMALVLSMLSTINLVFLIENLKTSKKNEMFLADVHSAMGDVCRMTSYLVLRLEAPPEPHTRRCDFYQQMPRAMR